MVKNLPASAESDMTEHVHTHVHTHPADSDMTEHTHPHTPTHTPHPREMVVFPFEDFMCILLLIVNPS